MLARNLHKYIFNTADFLTSLFSTSMVSHCAPCNMRDFSVAQGICGLSIYLWINGVPSGTQGGQGPLFRCARKSRLELRKCAVCSGKMISQLCLWQGRGGWKWGGQWGSLPSRGEIRAQWRHLRGESRRENWCEGKTVLEVIACESRHPNDTGSKMTLLF